MFPLTGLAVEEAREGPIVGEHPLTLRRGVIFPAKGIPVNHWGHQNIELTLRDAALRRIISLIASHSFL